MMGSCFSAAASTTADDVSQQSTAKIITLSGELQFFYSPIKASLVLGDNSPFFLCNSDSLAYDEHIPALKPEEQIIPGHLYFVLPVEKLHYPLSGADMAALAVKASSALLEAASGKGGRSAGNKKVRVMPGALVGNEGLFDDGLGGSDMSIRPVPVQKKKALQSNRSTRSKIAPISSRSTLGTIEEDSE